MPLTNSITVKKLHYLYFGEKKLNLFSFFFSGNVISVKGKEASLKWSCQKCSVSVTSVRWKQNHWLLHVTSRSFVNTLNKY